MEWERDVGAAVQSLSQVNMRLMRKGCKVKPFTSSSSLPSAPSSSSSSSPAAPAKQAQVRGKLYIVLEGEKAIDLVWLGFELPDHLISVLVSERVPSSVAAVLRKHQKSGKWITHLSHCVNVLFCLSHLCSDFPLILENVFSSRPSPPNTISQSEKIVDAMLFCFTIGIAVQCSKQDPAEVSQDEEDEAATVEQESRNGGDESEAQGEESTTSSQADGILPGDAVVSGTSAVDLIGHSLQVLASLLRMECRAREGARKSEGSDQFSFRQDLTSHKLITETICNGLFDAISIFIAEVDETSDVKRRKELHLYISNAIEVLYYCSLDADFVADLLVSNHMQDGLSLSVLKKVLLIDQIDIVSLLLKWLLLFCEYEDPPTIDVLAGYDIYNKLLISLIERNNTAMIAWGVKQPFNPLASDLLKMVELFGDDSNFKQRVIDASSSAIAEVLKRGPDYNGFTKSDKMHLPFTRAFFKLLAALHCFNPEVMKPEEENLFVRSLKAQSKSNEDVESIKSSLESLQNLPELSKRSKETIVEEVSEEDMELMRDLTEAFLQADLKKGKPHVARKTNAGGRGSSKGTGGGEAGGRVPEKSQEEFSKHTEQSRKKGRAKAQRARARLTEEEQIRLAIEASLKEQ
ncbi:hypothetical protein GUITHDRAFT_101032 [Guillardia theta CCMP2712]|uniref:Uncharacterized protein n=1 Tax=Guillardia theta (strain CCMP2712) TaxID=905079 RepID=L1JYQ8_GUITC|nr:hypothetical protein GUITHDRAFT_101032 [Guillardia theta CCMP2712]EKX53330.1 hypothetical protein GUITHDRAFT_101032 [Guillardia theta CCMP2712]|eukprot:XP_005840310.1 hypothetical protein GUITHDRAFT_101032 [Guillardia theta CCMP2712]